MALPASCPACGAQVLFKTGSSVVVVCESCHSVVARTDRGVEDAGKVADVVESGSPLEVGLGRVYLGAAFELTGRPQLRHPAGVLWERGRAPLRARRGRSRTSFGPARLTPTQPSQATKGGSPHPTTAGSRRSSSPGAR